jgi:glycosyltransferase involved in cell wall biosynthesis
MNWKAHQPVQWGGRSYGQKDASFERFMDLPGRVGAPLEVAVAGDAPRDRLRAAGWAVADAHAVTADFETYRGHIQRSRGEWSVCKQVFVGMRTGWFSDSSAAYLAAGRPVVLEDTGFGQVLPTGEGLFAVRDVDEAAAAIEAIESDYPRHSSAASAIAREHLDATEAMRGVLAVCGGS